MREIEEEEKQPMWTKFWIFFWIVLLLGLMAFVTSCVCFFYEGKSEQKWLGLVVSIILGPFYWIYFASVDEKYCSSSVTSVQRKQATPVSQKRSPRKSK
jgi:lipopolysaccharide export LptBFGC system permease protein LptF